jgi:hypothetical protein
MTEDFMEQDHTALGEIFHQLASALGEGDRVRAFELLDLAWARLAVHIRAEHLHLFPAVLNSLAEGPGRGDGARPSLVEAREAIERLREDHNFFMRELADSVKTMRELSRGASDDVDSKERMEGVRQKATAIVARLKEHNRLEESKVYRWPATILEPQAKALLKDSLRREIENMPPRFDDPTLPIEQRRE